MAERHEVRSYDYVNQPYARVREALTADTAGTFRAATRAAAARAKSVAAELRVNIAGLDLAAEILVSIGEIVDEKTGPFGSPVTRIPVSWEAAHSPRLFPLMNGELRIYPLTSTETSLDFTGRYEPPFGVIGSALDAIAGHRIAEASVHRLIADLAHYLRGRGGSGNG